MSGRQCADARPNLRALFVELGGFVRGEIMVGQIGKVFLNFVVLLPGKGRKRQGPFFSKVVAITVEQDGAEPGEKLALPVVTAQASPRLHKRILCEVFGQGGIPAQNHGLSQKPGFIGPADAAERLGITGSRQVQQTPGVLGFDLHERWVQAEHISIIIQNRDNSTQEPAGVSHFGAGIKATPACPHVGR